MAGKNLPTTGTIPTTPEAERGLRVDLTPLDMYFAGFIVRRHLYLGYWCWWHGHPSGGSETCAPYETLDEVYVDARWRMTGKQYVEKVQPQLLGIAPASHPLHAAKELAVEQASLLSEE